MKAKSKVSKNKKWSISDRSYTIILFGLSLLLFCIVCIPGESVWMVLHNFVLGMFGFCSIFWPLLLTYISILFSFSKVEGNKIKIWLLSIFIIVLCCEVYLISGPQVYGLSQLPDHIVSLYKDGTLNMGSGIIGGVIGNLISLILGITGARVVCTILLFIFAMLLTGLSLDSLIKNLCKPFVMIKNKIKNYRDREVGSLDKRQLDNKSDSYSNDVDKKIKIDIPLGNDSRKTQIIDETAEGNDSENETLEIAKITSAYMQKLKQEKDRKDDLLSKRKAYNPKVNINDKESNVYRYPSIDFLNESGKIKEDDITTELQTNGQMLVDTLKSFNVRTKIIAVSRGPAVTRYELQPASGVKISKITSLANDIALNLAATGVRIEAPIPGKAAVGIEIPNKVVSVVNMKELISSSIFRKAKSKLTVVLGRNISGKVVVADLAEMPHLLIAGSTGSGKSVCINSFIISLLYKSSPDEVKLIMIDPKVVELSIYNGIPHLLIPVVTDPRKAKGALGWAVTEMMRRYKVFAENNVRDVYSYNRYVENYPDTKDSEGKTIEKMYSVVIIIDELSDLMMVAPNEVEDYICRLAQMARAAGMHLVIATQRPSVDVITGIIKANIPSRVALAVSSQVDSRTILDMSGAESLLGRGDMLFSPIGASKPMRIQGCYVTDKEIENIVSYINDSQKNDYDDDIIDEIEKNADYDKKENTGSEKSNDMDPIMREAVQCVVEAGQASTSLLQRRLRLGYARAGRLIDEMEKLGIVGPHEGSKPRQVLVNYQQFLEMELRGKD